jgi:hypothetical protein
VPSNPGLGDALQGAEGVLLLAEDDETFLNSVHEQGLAELELGNVAMQIDRCVWNFSTSLVLSQSFLFLKIIAWPHWTRS